MGKTIRFTFFNIQMSRSHLNPYQLHKARRWVHVIWCLYQDNTADNNPLKYFKRMRLYRQSHFLRQGLITPHELYLYYFFFFLINAHSKRRSVRTGRILTGKKINSKRHVFGPNSQQLQRRRRYHRRGVSFGRVRRSLANAREMHTKNRLVTKTTPKDNKYVKWAPDRRYLATWKWLHPSLPRLRESLRPG